MTWYWYIYHVFALWCIWVYVRAIVTNAIRYYHEAQEESNKENHE